MKNEIPKNYKSYNKIILCSNTLLNVNQIIDDNGFFPIFIGKDEFNKPQIWLNAKTDTGIIKLIDANNSLIDIIKIDIYENNNQLIVVLNDKGNKHIILQIENINQDVPEITQLDLRTIGYNIHGDKNKLSIGSSEMLKSTFQVSTLIKI